MGKDTQLQLRGLFWCREPHIDLPHLAGPWEPAAGMQEEGKKGYLIIIIRGITQKRLAIGKQINLVTLLIRHVV